MWQFRFSALSGALALVALAVAGSGAARAAATEVAFGDIVPSGLGSGGCSHSGTDPGFVCNNGQTFSGGGDTFTANGYSGNLGGTVTATALTWKPDSPNPAPPNFPPSPNNSFGESGLGENATGPTSACSDSTCEATDGTSVLVQVTSGSNPIVDVIIGSVQANAEQFNLFGATSLNGPLTEISYNSNTTFNSGNCQNYSTADATCTFDLTGDNLVEIGLSEVATETSGQPSDALITAVSVPAPPIGHGFLVVLAAGGLLFGCRLYDRSRKRGSDAAALLNAA